jgi:hypothetical protein
MKIFGWREKIWMKRNTSREFERGGMKEIDGEKLMERDQWIEVDEESRYEWS